jgi:hypothetical protein
VAIYDINGARLVSGFNADGGELLSAYDKDGNVIFPDSQPEVDYTNYSFVQKWGSKGISNAQGFDIYSEKVFWVAKSGDDTIPSNCYVWNLADGTQALSAAYITIYSGHGNNVSFDYPSVYASTAYPPSKVYVNQISQNLSSFELIRTLTFNDGTSNLDCCFDENDKTILWTIGHISLTSTTWIVSKWDLTSLTENDDGTFTPALLQTGTTPQPQSNRYFQGIRHHDGMLWYASGDGSQRAYIYAINPNDGAVLYSIDLETNTEPEGLAWVEDADAVGGYVLYVGFQGMMLRKYTFGAR